MTDWRPSYRHVRTGRRAETLRHPYPECDEPERRLSPEFFDRYLAGRGMGGLTAISGVRQGPGILASAQRVAGSETGDLHEALAAALSAAVGDAGPVDIAVSGGIDSWLLAA